MLNQNVPPPDFGGYGSCGPDLNDGASCSITCDNLGSGFVWNVAGADYTCNNGVWGGGPQSCQFADYVPGKKNCTYPNFYYYLNTVSACSSQCGGTQTITRSPYAFGEAGGEPCPALSWNRFCGNNYCTMSMDTQGYIHWGPFCAQDTARTINYRFQGDRNIDLYVFDAADYTRYTWDASLVTPLNAYYSPAYAHLNTNFEIDSFTVPPNQCYFFVLDDTNVGPTATRDDDNNGVPDQFYVRYSFSNVNAEDGFTDFSYQAGQFQAGLASSLSASFFGAVLIVVMALLLN